MHIQFSTRREDIEQHKRAEQWFRQPNHGGTAKDVSWRTKSRLYDVRESITLLTNAALAREGIALAVDHRSLEARGLSRDPARYGSAHDKADLDRTLSYRQQLSDAGRLAYEQLSTYVGWQDQAVKLLSLDRQYIKDLTTSHVWRYDKSPTRRLEREQAMHRQFKQARGGHEPPRQSQRQTQAQTQTRTLRQTPTRSLAQQLRALAARLEGEEVGQGTGLRVKLHEEQDREHRQGMSW
jgi:MobA/MobL family